MDALGDLKPPVLPVFPSLRLDGKNALVTGASQGIGLAIASAYAQAGATVVLAARSQLALNQACAAIRLQGGVCEALRLDVTDSVAVDTALSQLPLQDIVVNCAGMNRPMLLIDTSDQVLDEVFDLNVKAAFYTARAAAKRLMEAKRAGSIINVSSQMGQVGSPKRTVYCASKHALEGMSKALAWELGPYAIRVNTLAPTFIETAMTAHMLAQPGFRDWATSRIALGRLGRIEEVMGAAVFLASDAASLMTGCALMLDGGWTAV